MRRQGLLKRFRQVAPVRVRDAMIRRQFSGALCFGEQRSLEPRIRDVEHRGRNFGIALAADVCDTVLGQHDVPQVARDSHVAIVPADVGFERAAVRARRAHGDNRSPAWQLVRLRDEVVLAADAADDATIREPIRHERAPERRHHRRIDEARFPPLRHLRLPRRPQELVREADRHHPEERALGVRHGAQFLVELARPQQECPVQQGAIRLDAALEDSFAIQVQESVDEHLRDGIKALVKRRVAAKRALRRLEARQEPDVPQHAPPVGVVAMPQRHRIDDRVAELADADLDGSAVPDEHARGERDGVIGGRDRQVRRRNQLVVGARVVHDEVEARRRQLRRAEHERHAIVDLPDDRRRLSVPLPRAKPGNQVRRDVRIRAEARAVPRGVPAKRNLLRDHVGAGGQGSARDVGVVDARIGLLRKRRAEPGAGLHEELLHADVCRQPTRTKRRDPFGLRRIAEDLFGDRLDETPLEFARGRRSRERESGQDGEFDARV